MTKIMLAFVLALVAILPVQANAEEHSHAHGPKLIAMKFHADWCGSCKVIGPQLEKARGKANLDNKDVLFVKLDLTNETTRHQSGLMAAALGQGDFYKTNNSKTGFILLINAKTGEHVGKITKEMDASQMASMIEEKIATL